MNKVHLKATLYFVSPGHTVVWSLTIVKQVEDSCEQTCAWKYEQQIWEIFEQFSFSLFFFLYHHSSGGACYFMKQMCFASIHLTCPKDQAVMVWVPLIWEELHPIREGFTVLRHKAESLVLVGRWVWELGWYADYHKVDNRQELSFC